MESLVGSCLVLASQKYTYACFEYSISRLSYQSLTRSYGLTNIQKITTYLKSTTFTFIMHVTSKVI